MSGSCEEIAFRSPFLTVYKDGRYERKKENKDFVPPGVHQKTGVCTKDVVVSPEIGVAVRLFLPPLSVDSSGKKRLPILVHFHGGGFCIGSAFDSPIHNHLTSLASEAGVLAVSVEYRLAPEHPMPIAYQDCWLAVQWVARQAVSTEAAAEPWLANHGDFDRIFFIGESAGANFAHHMAMAAGGAPAFRPDTVDSDLPVKVVGLIKVHTVFSLPDATEDDHWKMVCPATTLPDDPLINLTAASSPELSKLPCSRVLLCVAGKDHLRERGLFYYERLKNSGWKGELELEDTEGEPHCFHMFDPDSPKAKQLMKRIVSFINGE